MSNLCCFTVVDGVVVVVVGTVDDVFVVVVCIPLVIELSDVIPV